MRLASAEVQEAGELHKLLIEDEPTHVKPHVRAHPHPDTIPSQDDPSHAASYVWSLNLPLHLLISPYP